MRFACVMLALVVSMATLATDPAQAQPSATWNFELLGWVNYDARGDLARIVRLGDKIAVVTGSSTPYYTPGKDLCQVFIVDASDPSRPVIVGRQSVKNRSLNGKDVLSVGNFLVIEDYDKNVEILRYDGDDSLVREYHAESYVNAYTVNDLIVLSKQDGPGMLIFKVSGADQLTLAYETHEIGSVAYLQGQILGTGYGLFRLSSDGLPQRVNFWPVGGNVYHIGSEACGNIYYLDSNGFMLRHQTRDVQVVENNLGYGAFSTVSSELAVIDMVAFNTPYYLKATYPLNEHAGILVEGDLVYYATGLGHMGILRYTGGPASGAVLDAEVVASQFPTSMTAGESTTATLELRNSGLGYWSSAMSFKLAILEGGDLLFEPGQTRREFPGGIYVPPGGTCVFELPLRIPAFGVPTGPVTLRMQMVQEWEEFFGPVIEKVIYVSERNAAGNWLLLD